VRDPEVVFAWMQTMTEEAEYVKNIIRHEMGVKKYTRR
jgi:hypothetical protein